MVYAKSTVAAFLAAFLISAALTPIVRRIALAAGAADDAGGRRIHVGRIPRLGGVAVALAFFIPLLLLFFLDSWVASRFFADPHRALALGVGASMVLALGMADDLIGVGPRNKLIVQCMAAVVAWLGGYEISSIIVPFAGRFGLGYLSLPVTVLWFVGLINALNLIDGLDGLAAGIAFFACITNLVVGTVNESLLVVLLSAALGGGLLGFLVYNFNPASIFMGDSGSMFLGFVLAATGMLGSTIKSSTTVAIIVPLLVLGVPITDTVWALARRVRQRRSIFSADRGHIHHRLLDMGLSQRRAVVILYAISIMLAAAAVGLALGLNGAAGAALILMAIMLAAIVRTARMFALDRFPPIRQRRLLPIVEDLRRNLPPLLGALEATQSVNDAIELMHDFSSASGVTSCKVFLANSWSAVASTPLSSVPPSMSARRLVFPLAHLGEGSEVTFRLPETAIHDQTHILLQLAADALERSLARLVAKGDPNARAPDLEGANAAVADLQPARGST